MSLQDLQDLVRRAEVLEQEGRLSEATGTYLAGLTLARSMGHRRAEFTFVNRLGLVHEAADEPEMAIKFHEDAIELARELNDPQLLAGTLITVADLYLLTNRREEAFRGLESTAEFARNVGDRELEGKAFGMLGQLRQREGDDRDAGAGYELARQCFHGTGNRSGEIESLLNLGLMMQRLKRNREAVQHREAGLRLLESISEHERASLLPELRDPQLPAKILNKLEFVRSAQQHEEVQFDRLRYDGIYQSGIEAFWGYLRFFADGSLIHTGPTSGSPENIRGWFHRDSPSKGVDSGSFSTSDGLVRFRWPFGSVDCEAVTSTNGLTLKTYNHANGRRGTSDYHFIRD